jgi:hypothetical protein
MEIWHVLENDDEVNTYIKDKNYEPVGTFVHPKTLRPMYMMRVDYICIDGEMEKVTFAAPLSCAALGEGKE